jgi:hypothetical protein
LDSEEDPWLRLEKLREDRDYPEPTDSPLAKRYEDFKNKLKHHTKRLKEFSKYLDSPEPGLRQLAHSAVLEEQEAIDRLNNEPYSSPVTMEPMSSPARHSSPHGTTPQSDGIQGAARYESTPPIPVQGDLHRRRLFQSPDRRTPPGTRDYTPDGNQGATGTSPKQVSPQTGKGENVSPEPKKPARLGEGEKVSPEPRKPSEHVVGQRQSPAPNPGPPIDIFKGGTPENPMSPRERTPPGRQPVIPGPSLLDLGARYDPRRPILKRFFQDLSMAEPPIEEGDDITATDTSAASTLQPPKETPQPQPTPRRSTRTVKAPEIFDPSIEDQRHRDLIAIRRQLEAEKAEGIAKFRKDCQERSERMAKDPEFKKEVEERVAKFRADKEFMARQQELRERLARQEAEKLAEIDRQTEKVRRARISADQRVMLEAASNNPTAEVAAETAETKSRPTTRSMTKTVRFSDNQSRDTQSDSQTAKSVNPEENSSRRTTRSTSRGEKSSAKAEDKPKEAAEENSSKSSKAKSKSDKSKKTGKSKKTDEPDPDWALDFD